MSHSNIIAQAIPFFHQIMCLLISICYSYKFIHEDLTNKTRIMTLVLKVLKDYNKTDSLPSFHYNNMMEELQIIAPEITEEMLLQYGVFVVQQVSVHSNIFPFIWPCFIFIHDVYVVTHVSSFI